MLNANPTFRRFALLVFAATVCGSAGSAQLAQRVRDWTTGFDVDGSSVTASNLHGIGERAVFWTGSGRDWTLWATDGSDEGTQPLLRPCLSGSSCDLRFTAVMDGGLFFQTSVGLIHTDGTPNGTGLLIEEEIRRVRHVANRERSAYFTWDFVGPGNSDTLRMISIDGSVDTLRLAAEGLGPADIRSVVPQGGRTAIVHATHQTSRNEQLWWSDGTTATPLAAVDLEGFPLVALFSTASNPVLAYYGQEGLRLRRSTLAEPVGELLLDSSEPSFGFASFVRSDEWLVATVVLDNGPRYGLLISGGTPETTHFLADGWPALLSGVIAGDALYVSRATQTTTTIQSVDLRTGVVTELPQICSSFCAPSFHEVGGRALIYVDEGEGGRLWHAGPGLAEPEVLSELTGLVSATDRELVLLAGSEQQLLVTDGTSAGTTVRFFDEPLASGETARFGGNTLIALTSSPEVAVYPDLGPRFRLGPLLERELGSDFPLLAAMEDRLLLATPTDPVRLATTDGSQSGTVVHPSLLADLDCAPRSFHPGNSRFALILCAPTPSTSAPFLVRSDGTEAGTSSLVTLPAGTEVRETIEVGTWVAIRTNNALWGTDGDSIEQLVPHGRYNALSVVGDRLFFNSFGIDSTFNESSDGTSDGTRSIDGTVLLFGVEIVGAARLGNATLLVFRDGAVAELTPDDSAIAHYLHPIRTSPRDVLGTVANRLLVTRGRGEALRSFDPYTGSDVVVTDSSPIGSDNPFGLDVARSHHVTEDFALLTLVDDSNVPRLFFFDGFSALEVLSNSSPVDFPSGFRAGRHSRDGEVLFSGSTRSAGRELMAFDTTGFQEEARVVHDVFPGPDSAGVQTLYSTDTHIFFTADDGLHGTELYSLDTTETSQRCSSSTTPLSLCLTDDRFRAELSFRTDRDLKEAQPSPLEDDTGGFWFFDEENLEVMTKVVDGAAINGNFWSFVGSLTDVAFDLTLTDAQTGRSRRYSNRGGTFASLGDVDFLPAQSDARRPHAMRSLVTGLGPVTAPRSTDICDPSVNLCLVDGRFRVDVEWQDFAGTTGFGHPRPVSDDTGAFWFFDEANLEVLVKVLDGRAINGNFWVYFGSLSNIAFTLGVTDTVTGARVTYDNPLGMFASRGDVDALADPDTVEGNHGVP